MSKGIEALIDRRVFITEAEQITGLERTTLHRRCKSGAFPAPHYVGRRRAWLLSEINAWHARQLSNRTPPSAPSREDAP
jgi:predicted DNA-binding transcriptional regulator AlpA